MNLRQPRYERGALTTELLTRLRSDIIIALRLDEAFFARIAVQIAETIRDEIFHNREQNHKIHKTAPAVAEHRQRHPDDRGKSDGHRDIDAHIDEKEQRYPPCNNLDIIILRPKRDDQQMDDQRGIQRDQ